MNSQTFRPRITAVADSDSYLKLAYSTLSGLGSDWDKRVVLVRTPLLPTDEQIISASHNTSFAGTRPEVLPMSSLTFDSLDADIIFASSTGPVVSELFSKLLRSTSTRVRPAALLSALPGVAFPATTKGWNYRRAGDGFIVHSHAEAREFSQLAEEEPGHSPTILVSKLPFLATAGFPQPETSPINSVVFAAQAKVPVLRTERVAILRALDKTACLNPAVRVIVKLRAKAGEPQTHAEAHPFDSLWNELVEAGSVKAQHVEFTTGSMDAVLNEGAALLTVSSTAALEALDRGLPVLVLTDFGFNEAMLNTVFRGSGLLGTLEQVPTLEFSSPNKAWLRENYFHRRGPEFGVALNHYASRARAGELETSEAQRSLIRDIALRQHIRTALPRPVLSLLRKLRRSWLRTS
ncbi:hypothetical protein CQ018_14955 [Arthrobacter sp. MYb227]|uniref:DUF6716 putative glycosyltransferase n=1 Tax=Arthrobacter sp. MYb227 TaxID=1848601 RepID=UPI000CFC9B60|nr:DUF6716 putative glycosyltransferase [Arthrobacter sp. MYb227]PQZ90288.1 hypothetical protein CQ018_14955 [Arthrobacter sp. MYb227]